MSSGFVHKQIKHNKAFLKIVRKVVQKKDTVTKQAIYTTRYEA